MAYRHEIVGYELVNTEQVIGEAPDPSLLSAVDSVLVHAWNEDDPEDQKHFWAHSIYPFEDWESWEYYIDDLMDMYGLPTA